MYASRNITLCNKDCICLYVCPTGATDTETGQIDASKCLDGCRLCADACPSKAIFLVYENYPEQKKPNEAVAATLASLISSKCLTSLLAESLSTAEPGNLQTKLLKALAHSNRLIAEDCFREAGFMIPDNSDLETSMGTDYLLGLYKKSFPSADTTGIASILKALIESADTKGDTKGDTEGDSGFPNVYICETCGIIAIGEKPAAREKCENCGSEDIKKY
jgi:ferredoxin